MKHFAQIDDNNLVTGVFESNDMDTINATMSGNFVEVVDGKVAGPGYTYDSESSSFIAPKPYESWTLDENKKWVAPVAMPPDPNILWNWNEGTRSWDNGGNNKPYPSWTWDEESGMFQPPVPHPTGLGTGNYRWDEDNQRWNVDSSWQEYG